MVLGLVPFGTLFYGKFRERSVIKTPRHYLCRQVRWTRDIETDSSGVVLKSILEEVCASLSCVFMYSCVILLRLLHFSCYCCISFFFRCIFCCFCWIFCLPLLHYCCFWCILVSLLLRVFSLQYLVSDTIFSALPQGHNQQLPKIGVPLHCPKAGGTFRRNQRCLR